MKEKNIPAATADPMPMLAYTKLLLLLLVLIASFSVESAAQTLPKTDPKEVQALNSIFRQWGISANKSRAKWNLTDDICHGLPLQIGQNFESEDRNPYIVCNCDYDDGATCHITRLKAFGLGIVGRIPDELQNLEYLENLQIARNNLTGELPHFIGNFSRLQYLSVGRNALSGPVPKELGKLKALKSLGMDSCNFSGPLPEELGNMARLEQMYIDSTGLSGEIPKTFVNLTKLQTWWAGDNNFGGKVPEFIGNMTNLQSLKFQGNSFNGPIPSSFARLTKLTLLYLSDLSGESSSIAFTENMSFLVSLVLRDSRITDVLPLNFSKFPALTVLDLSFNNLTGQIPPSLFKLQKLEDLYLGSNNLNGSLPEEKSSSLLNIDLSYNGLSGDIPSWQSDSGLNMNLVANNFDDSSKGLSWQLKCLQKSFPCYRGSPVYYSSDINCGGDEFVASDGTVYDSDNNNLLGASYFLRDDFRWAVSSTGKFLGADSYYKESSQSSIANTLDSVLFTTTRMAPSSLRYYGLALENGNYTIRLKFVELAFPNNDALKSHGKRIFDIYIQGIRMAKDFNIKEEADNNAFTPVIRNYTAIVKDNVLEVHLFWAGKGTTAIPDMGYYGPSIAAISISPNFKPTVPNRLPARKKKTSVLIGVIVGIVLPFSVLVAIGILIWRQKRRNIDDEELRGLEFMPNIFSLTELKNATKDFSPANKLGEGGFGAVFKGKLHDGRMVAVKQLSVPSSHGKRQFVTEIATISAVQHRNLVKLHGCCFEGGHRLLVYEFLENSSLDFALFGKTDLQLDWPARYNICVGTARGLAYLHEESRLRIIHRDIKASNILIDSDLNPKLSDFGLAILFDDKMTHVSTRVAGTIGYLAPEYALRGHLTEKADTFGFGIVILEILTGKPNTARNSAGEKMYLLDWAWQLHESNLELEMMDPRLPSYNRDEAIRMIGIAFLCTQTDPTLRPPMSRVVAMLVGEVEISDAISKPAYLADWKYDEEYSASTVGSLTSKDFESSSQGVLDAFPL